MYALPAVHDRRDEVFQNWWRRAFFLVAVTHPTTFALSNLVQRVVLLPVVGRVAQANEYACVLLNLLGLTTLLGKLGLQQAGRE